MNGRQPLAFLVRHVLEPLSSILAVDRVISVGTAGPLSAVLTDENVAGELAAFHGKTESRKKPEKVEEDTDVRMDEEEAEVEHDAADDDAEDESTFLPRSPSPLKTKLVVSSRIDPSPSGSPVPLKPAGHKKRKPRSPTPTAPAEREDASTSTSPPRHTPAASQKSKKNREKEEEEALEKRREEMRRRMGTGGGGRLGKRRLGR